MKAKILMGLCLIILLVGCTIPLTYEDCKDICKEQGTPRFEYNSDKSFRFQNTICRCVFKEAFDEKMIWV